jgi:putative transposase
MSRAVSPSVDRVYGLVRVARCWNVSRATVYRHRQAPAGPKRRPGPVGPGDDATLLRYIRQAIAESRFTGEGYRKIWARLRFAGIRSSPGRVRRLMRENGLLAPGRKGPDKAHDGSITTEAVDVMWGTDMSQTVTLAEGVAHVFVAVDHCNSECVGIHADKSANRFQAL